MSCQGCGREIYLTGKAIELLELLGEYAFLPLGEEDGKPFFISESGERYESSVKALRLFGLITLDYDMPISGFDYSAYSGAERLGSMALTRAGQDALEALNVQGAE